MHLKIPEQTTVAAAMNAAQFDYIAAAVIRSEKQRKAVRRHVIDGLTANAAEKEAYGAEVKTVSRDAIKIRCVYQWAMGLKPATAGKV